MLNVLLLAALAPQIPPAVAPGEPGPAAVQGRDLVFEARLLAISPNEGCAVGDVDGDGDIDVTAGALWFAAPEFTPRPLREVAEVNKGAYLANNGEHLLDVDGDGRLDVISGSFFDQELCWYRNPGSEALERGKLWPRQVLGKVGGANEMTMLRDIDGDGTPEIVVNTWNDHGGVVVWRLVRDEGLPPRIEPFVLGARGHGHGMGWGDLDGDGDEDLLVKVGWYERPDGHPFAGPWTLHRDGDLGRASCPILIHDFDGDDRAELIIGQGHGYGLGRLVRVDANEQGGPRFERHVIDKSFSQAHTLLLVDLLGEGRPGFVTGKRVRGHEGSDPGSGDPTCLYYYRWDGEQAAFVRHRIAEGDGVGTGLQIRAADLDGDGRTDLAVSGKTGTWVLLQRGTAPGQEDLLAQRIALAEERLAMAERAVAVAETLRDAGRASDLDQVAERRFQAAEHLLQLRSERARQAGVPRAARVVELHAERVALAEAEVRRLQTELSAVKNLYQAGRRSTEDVDAVQERLLAARSHLLSLRAADGR